uniref:Annetocin n=1 Tax=Eisenia fetida TaxID=6396 RepID=OXYT_EISFE|nr:RecName: Full=Annetocin [Eisenia fetida]
CFVRNCPTG